MTELTESMRHMAERIISGDFQNCVVAMTSPNDDGSKRIHWVCFGDMFACAKISEMLAREMDDYLTGEDDETE